MILLIIPFVWSLIGTMAALKLSVYEDYGLLIAGISGLIILMVENKKDFRIVKTV